MTASLKRVRGWATAQITGSGAISRAFRAAHVRTLGDAAEYLTGLVYARTSGSDPLLVLRENRGTCSSKHAAFVLLCGENGIRASLQLGFFEMSEDNVPGVGKVLEEAGLRTILEAHCFAIVGSRPLDLTGLPHGGADAEYVKRRTMDPSDMGKKAQWHRTALAAWGGLHAPTLSPEELWTVREKCIAALSSSGRSSPGS